MGRTTEEEQRIMHDVITRCWKFGKNLLDCDLDSDKVWEKATTQVDEEFKSTPDDYKDFCADVFNAVLQQADRVRKSRKAVNNGQDK